MGKPKTRHSSAAWFGPSVELPDCGDLYTLRDILAACSKELEVSPQSTPHHIAAKIEAQVRGQWMECNPQLVLHTQEVATLKIIRAMEKSNCIKNNKGITTKQKKLFSAKIDKLFDLLICQCKFINCNDIHCSDDECEKVHIDCNCERKFKIPEMELQFVRDQREKTGLHGQMMMMDIDKEEVERLNKQEKRKPKSKKTSEPEVIEPQMETGGDPEDCDNPDVDPDFTAKITEKGNHNQNRVNLDDFVAEVMRYGISDRAAAALHNSTLRVHGIIIDGEDKLAVDKSKIRRSREAYSAKQKANQAREVTNIGSLQCLGSDGKRNKKTRRKVIQIINGKEVIKNVVGSEEHIVYTMEPNGSYLCHSEIPSGKGDGRGLADDFVDVLAEYKCRDSLVAVVADGTATNTGWKNGCLAHLERDLQKNLLWLICMAHGNELPFRHLFDHFDGGFGTSGPNSFHGPLGKACVGKIHLKDIVQFDSISTTVPTLDDKIWKDLSRDQQLLYRYTQAIAAGFVNQNLAIQVAGPINHSRWLTLAIRLQQEYTRTKHPSAGFKLIVKYIQQVYSPTWFLVKSQKKFTVGPSHLFNMMKLIKTQSADVQRIAKPVVQRNAYFAEPGVMLCAMLESESGNVRSSAVKMIKKGREKPPKPSRMKLLRGVRKHENPALQWSAGSWDKIIDWNKVKVFEPEILKKMSLAKIEGAIDTPLDFPNFPVHSQTVERAVKLVTEAASVVCGADERHKHILSVNASRKSRKMFDTKKNYKVI